MTDVTTPAIKPTAHKYDTIQVYRFIAALMVIILHSTLYAAERLQPGLTLYTQGHVGVILFFAISGFVMIISSENLLKKTGGWKIFAIKRLIRIVPIYWVITTYKVVLMIFAASLINHARLDWVYILKSYFFIPAFNVDGIPFPFYGVGWTLNFEMFFYLWFTIALAVKIRPMLLLAPIFIGLAILSVFKTPQWPAIGFYADPIVLYFLYGMVAAKLVLSGKLLPAKFSAIVIVLCLIYLFCPRMPFMYRYVRYDEVITHAITFITIYAGASVEKYWSHKIPAALVYLGGVSYSLYLIHPSIAPIVPTVLKKLNLIWAWPSVTLSVVAALIAGTLFYKFCETPLTRIFTGWAKKLKWI